MGNVKMGTDGNYRTSDLYVAAWLLANGLQVQGIDRHNPQRFDFIFLDREDRPRLVQTFVRGQAIVIFLILFTTLGKRKGYCIHLRCE